LIQASSPAYWLRAGSPSRWFVRSAARRRSASAAGRTAASAVLNGPGGGATGARPLGSRRTRQRYKVGRMTMAPRGHRIPDRAVRWAAMPRSRASPGGSSLSARSRPTSSPSGMRGRKKTLMANEPLHVGDLVEIASAAEHAEARPITARRYGYVVETADEDNRVAVQVQGRRYPSRVPLSQLYRASDAPHCAADGPVATGDGPGQPRLIVNGVRYSIGSTRRFGR
jgi:hypothetical protein